MSNKTEIVPNQDSKLAEPEVSPTNQVDAAGEDDEFQLTIRKLEMPVRPRGVLAE